MRISWSEKARRDLDELVAYISQDSVQNAILVRERVLSASRLLGSTPLIGRIHPRKPIREWIVANTGCVLQYRVIKDAVSILSLMRGTRLRD